MASMLDEWTRDAVPALVFFLWAQTMEAVNINRDFVAMYGTDVVSVQ